MHALKVTARIEAKGEGEMLIDDHYLWNVRCNFSSKGISPSISFSQDKKFPSNKPNGAIVDSGTLVESSVVMEFDKSLVKLLQKGQQMACSFGYQKPVGYEGLSMNQGQGVFPSYLLQLRRNQWVVEGWNF